MTAAGERRIGRYAIEGVIGTGAFATVYRATDERLDAAVAVKLLADNHCLDPDIRARFIGEGRALRRIDSPHVLRVYDVGETEQLQPYLVMEHADRGTLAQRVGGLRESGWRPGADDLRVVVTELAAAVEAVHAADLVHRDLSPGNVLLRSISGSAPAPAPGSASAPASAFASGSVPTPATTAGQASALAAGPGPVAGRPRTPLVGADERLVVADLGLAKDLARSSGLTVAAGTDGFRPPEQRGNPTRVDGRADLWALSAVVFWLVTGEAPGTSDQRQADRQLTKAVAELRLPPSLPRVLRTSLADDPARRHPDVAAWRDAVRQALAPPPAAPSISGSGVAPRRRAWGLLPGHHPSTAGAEADAGAAATFGAPASLPGRRLSTAGPDHDAGAAPWPRKSRRGAVVAVTLVLVGMAFGAVVAALWDARDDGGDGDVAERRLDDGQVELAATDGSGEARLVMVGPDEASVGDTVTFEAQAEGVDEWAWLMPDGTVYANEPSVQLRPRSAGTAEIALLATAPSGERLEVVHTLHLAGDGGG